MNEHPRLPRQVNLPLLLGVAGLVLLFALGGTIATVVVAWRWHQRAASEGIVEFELPASGESRVLTELREPDQEALKPEITIVLKAARDGANKGTLREIVVRTPEGTRILRTLPELADCLRSWRPKLANKDDIQVEAETALKYSYVIDAMDTCVKEGFTHVGFSPPPDLKDD
jgi:biopolymer transport protein ExbD